MPLLFHLAGVTDRMHNIKGCVFEYAVPLFVLLMVSGESLHLLVFVKENKQLIVLLISAFIFLVAELSPDESEDVLFKQVSVACFSLFVVMLGSNIHDLLLMIH